MISFTTFLLSAAIGAFVYLFILKRDGKKYPPGPLALPLLGNGLQLKKDSHLVMQNWAKQYGSIFKVKLGKDTAYVISDLKTLRELFNDSIHNARPRTEAFEAFRSGPHGVTLASGQEWAEQRRFTLRHLRDFGFGKSSGEETIMIEVRDVLSTLTKEVGKPISLDRTFQVAIMNTLWMITTGNRYQHDDPRLWSVFDLAQEFVTKMGTNPALVLFPNLAKLLPSFSGWDVLLKLKEATRSIIQGHIDEHKKTFPEDGVLRDFFDAYLNEINKTTDPNSSFYKDAGNTSLIANTLDFFLAGADTVSHTIRWGILYLCKFPQVQKKLQDELDSIVGRNRGPNLADRSSLPYYEAIFAETTRLSSFVPLGLNHCAEKDSKILGFDCPAGTQIVPNLYTIHHNEEYFPEPHEFKPERFLSSDRKTFTKHEGVLAFGYGKRACLGESLARDEFFLYFTNLFHKFSIRLADESKNVSLQGQNRFFLMAEEFKVVLTLRD